MDDVPHAPPQRSLADEVRRVAWALPRLARFDEDAVSVVRFDADGATRALMALPLALPFSVSMSRGADVSARSVEVRKVELLSASARDLMLGEAALGHATYDETPDSDGLDEFPASVPDAFPALRMDGRARLAAAARLLGRGGGHGRVFHGLPTNPRLRRYFGANIR